MTSNFAIMIHAHLSFLPLLIGRANPHIHNLKNTKKKGLRASYIAEYLLNYYLKGYNLGLILIKRTVKN